MITMGHQTKNSFNNASFISYALDRGLGIRYATGPEAIPKRMQLSVFIGHMSDYSIDDVPAGTILVRLKGDFTQAGYDRNHAGVYLWKMDFVYKGVQYTNTPAVISLSGKHGEKAAVTIVPYIGRYTHLAWPKGLALPNTPVNNAPRATGEEDFL